MSTTQTVNKNHKSQLACWFRKAKSSVERNPRKGSICFQNGLQQASPVYENRNYYQSPIGIP